MFSDYDWPSVTEIKKSAMMDKEGLLQVIYSIGKDSKIGSMHRDEDELNCVLN